ncbi:MAG: pseudouridine synthase [Phascolarctobacterium faecium]
MEFNFSYTVFYEDEYLLIVNKPAGMLVHPTVKEDGSTLYNYVAHYYKQQGLLHNIHPVSRLDRNTSGLVIFKRTTNPVSAFPAGGHKKILRNRYRNITS